MKKLIPILFSLCSGLFLSLPWLISGISWTLFFAFVPLLIAEDLPFNKKEEKFNISTFYLGFISFLFWNLLSTWWIGYVSVPGMLLIVGVNALIMASVWWLRHPLKRKLGVASGYFSLVIFWLSFEFLQHIWALQWPWLTLGNGFANSVKIIQWYEYTGVLGGSLWILLSNILIYFTVKRIIRKDFLESIKLAGFVFALILFPVIFSVNRYSDYSENGSSIEVLILQPNIDPFTDKFTGSKPEDQIDRLMSLANESVTESTNLILAPETALPDIWEDSVSMENPSFNSIYDILQRYPKVSFIGGAITKQKFNTGEKVSETARLLSDNTTYYDVFNSALLFNEKEKVQFSRKTILVSGVEKMPFQKYFAFLGKYLLHLGGMDGRLAEGEGKVFSLNEKSVRIGSVICFESAFGEHVGDLIKKGANLLVVVTNDGWWRQSVGVWQHFGYSRLRAIETRRDIARSANTGISGFISQRGDVRLRTKLDSRTTIHSKIRMNDKLTFYVSYGDYIGRIGLIMSGLVLVFYFYRR